MFIKKFFKKEINPFPVYDKARFRNVDRVMTLTVRTDAMVIVGKLKQAQAKIASITDDSPEEEKTAAALAFAASIFGEEQAKHLLEFYGDPLIVITVCGIYFKGQLSKEIIRAQKK